MAGLPPPPPVQSPLPPPATEAIAERRARARARAQEMVADMPSDAALYMEAKGILLSIARDADDDKNRVSAARALIDAVKPPPSKVEADDLNRLPADALMAEVEMAKRVAEGGMGASQ